MRTLQVVLSILSALVALVLLVEIIADREPSNVSFGGLVLLEVGLLVQFVFGLVMVLGDHRGVSVATYLAYLVGALLVLPIGFVWAASEKGRSGTGVLLVAVLVVPVLFLRLHDIWATHV